MNSPVPLKTPGATDADHYAKGRRDGVHVKPRLKQQAHDPQAVHLAQHLQHCHALYADHAPETILEDARPARRITPVFRSSGDSVNNLFLMNGFRLFLVGATLRKTLTTTLPNGFHCYISRMIRQSQASASPLPAHRFIKHFHSDVHEQD